MSLLENIAKRIRSQPHSNWIYIACKIGIDVNDIDKIKKKQNSATEFVLTLTNKIWQEIFKFVNIPSNDKDYVTITNIDKLASILNGNIKCEQHDVETEFDILKEIASRVADSRKFARILGIKEKYITEIEKTFPASSLYAARNLEVMERKFHPLPPSTSWEFWRQYLQQLTDGKIIIEEMEIAFPNLLKEVTNTGGGTIGIFILQGERAL